MIADWREFRARLVNRTSTDNLAGQSEPSSQSTLESQVTDTSLSMAVAMIWTRRCLFLQGCIFCKRIKLQEQLMSRNLLAYQLFAAEQ
eukprot:1146365-Pelagomonas_calceolata.AAC.1